MGWCSGTTIFDSVAEYVLETSASSDDEKFGVLRSLADAMENEDWDCQQDSRYYAHPIVQRVFSFLHPDWDDDLLWEPESEFEED